MNKIIIIGGATASGKTSLAVSVAKVIGGEIICMDSMQVYKNMDIGTAKVTTQEMCGVPHHMIDIVSFDQQFSAAEYAKLSKQCIADIITRGNIPIFCGGTGLYIDSIIYPFDFGKVNADEGVRQRLFAELDSVGAEEMHRRLTMLDPLDAAKIHPNNTKRLLRALEIIEVCGTTKSQTAGKTLQYDVRLFAVEWDREVLYDRINHRVDVMFQQGLVGEVDRLYAGNIDNFNYQSMQAIGYKEFRGYYEGTICLDEVKTQIAKASRNYAKRQLTWLRKYDFTRWLQLDSAVDNIVKLYK